MNTDAAVYVYGPKGLTTVYDGAGRTITMRDIVAAAERDQIEYVVVPMTPDDRETLTSAATEAGMAVADFVWQAAMEKIGFQVTGPQN